MISTAAAIGSVWMEPRTMNGRVERASGRPASFNSVRNVRSRSRRFDYGFTYMSALILIVVSGIALSEAGRLWQTISKREREEELLFRGDQIRRAIASYVDVAGQSSPSYPMRLEDLLKDPRFPGTKRHLRRIYHDPMTMDGKWALILNEGGGIKGVHTRSEESPLKSGNFPAIYASFENARTYADWNFLNVPIQSQPVSVSETGSSMSP